MCHIYRENVMSDGVVHELRQSLKIAECQIHGSIQEMSKLKPFGDFCVCQSTSLAFYTTVWPSWCEIRGRKKNTPSLVMSQIFFVLRKKNQHVSTLHVIHHGCMPMSVWFGVKFTPGGHSTFFGLLNTFVHIIMYTYYLLAALGPKVQKYLWWKKYLTSLQMAQFIAIMVHAFQLLFIDCNYPRAFVWWIGMHAVMFFFLFKEFYNQSYNRSMKAAAKVATANGVATNGVANGKVHQNGTQNGHAKTNGYSKQADYYATGDGLMRPDLVQRPVTSARSD
ncbi:Elongation of very long chain fatty acids protein 7 [Homalodisca vitripennis]|nr:Elongation of very long chain fatty acids protein 7 [Homalodisca vitripennis]